MIFNALALFACCYALPLGMITATYVLIFVTVWKRSIPGESLHKPGNNQQKDSNREMTQRSKLKVRFHGTKVKIAKTNDFCP